jgi:hypothetical protein
MKTNLLRSVTLLCAIVGVAFAAPLTQTAAVHTRPDPGAPAITYLKAGTDPVPATSMLGSTPAGWMAIELAGPFDGYVEKSDLTKALDIKPGSAIRLAPKADAGVLAVADKGDKITITGLHGKWTQVSLERKLIGYVNVGSAPGYLPPVATTPAGSAPSDQPTSPAPVAPVAYGAAGAGQAAPMVNLGDGGGASLPRQFAGKFVSTRRPFTPRRPYDWALNDDAGKRYAYVDISRLLQTEQIEKYANHDVVVFGTAKAGGPNGKDLVIEVESLQLR